MLNPAPVGLRKGLCIYVIEGFLPKLLCDNLFFNQLLLEISPRIS